MVTEFMAANLLARDWQDARTEYFDYVPRPGGSYDTVRLDEPRVPDIRQLRVEALAFLRKKQWTTLEFGIESSGGCETCNFEYPAITFHGKQQRQRGGFAELDVSVWPLPRVYEVLREGERLRPEDFGPVEETEIGG